MRRCSGWPQRYGWSGEDPRWKARRVWLSQPLMQCQLVGRHEGVHQLREAASNLDSTGAWVEEGTRQAVGAAIGEGKWLAGERGWLPPHECQQRRKLIDQDHRWRISPRGQARSPKARRTRSSAFRPSLPGRGSRRPPRSREDEER